jgi:flavin-dependent dehydrogenase
VLFERDLLPGYAWIFPLPGGRANVGFGMLRGDGVTGKVLAQKWRSLLDRPSVRAVLGDHAEPEDTARAWPIPTEFDPRRLIHGRVLFAGDAAAVVDAMTGEGIAQALDTGALAAEAIVRGEGVKPRYVMSVVRALGRDLRFAQALQRVLRHEWGARGALWTVDRTDWTRRNFARWMFEDYPRAILLTPDRWRRGMLTGPGAYRV